jgi:hypothetical protein
MTRSAISHCGRGAWKYSKIISVTAAQHQFVLSCGFALIPSSWASGCPFPHDPSIRAQTSGRALPPLALPFGTDQFYNRLRP